MPVTVLGALHTLSHQSIRLLGPHILAEKIKVQKDLELVPDHTIDK